MTDQEWIHFLDTLTPSERKLAQAVLSKLQHVLERDRSRAVGDIQAVERRNDSQSERIGMLHMRVDRMHELLEHIERRVEATHAGDTGDGDS